MRYLLCCQLLICLMAVATGQEQVHSHGARQLARILTDRPSMAGILPKDDVITKWVIRRLDLGTVGETVVWDNTEPDGGMALHVTGELGKPSLVRVTGSESMTGRDKWYLLVFELHNLMHPKKIAELRNFAIAVPHGRDQFAAAVLDYEYERLARTNRFFLRYPLPDTTVDNAPVYSHYMNLKTGLFKSEARSQMLEHQEDSEYGKMVRKSYATWYDRIRAHSIWQRSQTAEP